MEIQRVNKFIFDVDGTLTPSRGVIDGSFKEFFLEFIQANETYLVTGSDYSKTFEQLGPEICNGVKCIYNCSGNDVWINGENVKTTNWELPEEPKKWLLERLASSKFVLRTGNHIEARPGSVNFSVVGRNATMKERQLYVKWDNESGERHRFATEFNHLFHDLEARVGGETGLDIYPRGKDKSQVIPDFKKEDKVYFFGDRVEPGGNDYPLAAAITKRGNGMAMGVKDWEDTFERLAYFQEAGIAA
jgi:phosphomannomutase